MTHPSGTLKLGAFLSGHGSHNASWRLPEVDANASRSFAPYARVAQKLEEGLFDALFLNDSVAVPDLDADSLARTSQGMRWDPLTLLPALAVVTRQIGLISTANTTYNEPYTLARRLASLDHLSEGRAGWNLVTSLGGGENFNREDHVLHAQRYERAEEFFDVISGLWDSWEDDAFIQDKNSGIWSDPDKLHLLNHKGRHFAVQGPLNAARPVQGYPVIAQAGSSNDGRELAARTAELIFTAAQTIDEALGFNVDITARLAKYGRKRADIRILPGVSVYVGKDADDARARYEALQDLLDPVSALKGISRFVNLGVDLWKLPLDEPVLLPAAIPVTNTHKSRQQLVIDLIHREKPTVRQLLRKMVAGGHRILFGSAQDIADDFEHWFRAGAADGFNIMFPDLHGSVDRFVDQVVPELQRRGLFRTSYEGRTLRENLGLPRPTNRFVGKKREATG
ncbi:LLM class flavin-dependent oxidoreductase [Sphingobium sp. BYY-5]|uniref:LLM class flavin-dependent oxidoreductase n=1 Tax=Sphingobium sp. BYY-5 TaxID=2926400 RepID=UPI001FA740F0|nr:LLM class flavin-dependent oxidoreductase [Sphingobium sp. BYY-5]MCI4591778.1 LLM class flavin-dependent oxidoreductase [Sphingobium sp. BYY-5]